MAISSPLSSLVATSKETNKKTVGLGKLLSSSTSSKKSIFASTKLYRKRRIEIGKRNSLRDRFLIPNILVSSGGARRLTLSDTSTGVTDRLLGFIGYLSAGWILSNMPTWIALGEQFSSRLVTAGSIMSNYGDEAINVMNGIANVFTSTLRNISSFDFTDSSFLIRSSLNDLRMEIDKLGKGFDEAISVLLQPFTDIPKPGTYQPDEPDIKLPSTQPPSGGNADFWTLVAIVSREDSDAQGQADVAQSIYNRAKSGAYGSSNIRELILRDNQYEPTWQRPKPGQRGKPNPEWFQINDAKSAAKASGFSESTIKSVAANITNPTLQKNAAEFVQGRTDFKGSNSRFPGGIQRKPGDNYFGWQYGYRGTSTASVPNFGLSSATPPVATQRPTQPSITGQRRLQPGDIFTKSLGKDVDLITISSIVGDPRGGRTHGGIDITAPSGTYIALRVDAEWVAYSNQPGGYGHTLDLWIPSYGIQLRFAHLLEQPAKLSKIPAGRSFARVGSSGYSSGPHIHFEYDTKKGASRGGGARYDDPNYAAKLDGYVRLLLLTKNPNKGQFAPAPRPSTTLVPVPPSIQSSESQDQVEMETNAYLEGLLNGINQERQGRKIIVIDDRSSTTQQIVSPGGNISMQVQLPDSALLNNFIKNKLLLDLNYL